MSATAIVLAVLGVLLLAALWSYNRLVRLRNRAQAAYHDIDVQLRRRADLIPNLVETVKAYAAHERVVLDEVIAARAASVAASAQQGARGTGPVAQAQAEAGVTTALGHLFAVAEAYPDLKADANFRSLHDELVATENKLAFSRQLYNDTVQAYRDATQSFPGMFVASPLGFTAPEFFAIERGERGPANVELE